jgi:membrane-associated protein
MINIINYYLSIFDIEALIRYGGLLFMFLFVFGSIGLFFGFILPSGAVLFAAGVFVATGELKYDFFTISGLLILASVLGNLAAYWFGRKTGPILYRRKDSKFFKQQHLLSATVFYNKYGGVAIILGFNFPIIRTFAPIVAGMIRLNLRRFILFSIIGSAIWVFIFASAGYFIASMPFLKPWLKYILIGFTLLVTVPLVFNIIKKMRKPQAEVKK